jgi:hypothetical protein
MSRWLRHGLRHRRRDLGCRRGSGPAVEHALTRRNLCGPTGRPAAWRRRGSGRVHRCGRSRRVHRRGRWRRGGRRCVAGVAFEIVCRSTSLSDDLIEPTVQPRQRLCDSVGRDGRAAAAGVLGRGAALACAMRASCRVRSSRRSLTAAKSSSWTSSSSSCSRYDLRFCRAPSFAC